MSGFTVGVTNDLRTADGEPCFDAAAFDELAANPAISWQWIEEDVSEITPDICARFDALHVNLPTVTAASVARGDCRVRLIARNGVGFDTVDVEAMTDRGIIVTNTPIAVRRPVAVATLTLILALAGRLFKKDQLVRTGRWNDRVEHMGLGLTSRTLGLVGAGSIGKEIVTLAKPLFNRIVAADPHVDAGTLAKLGAEKQDLGHVLQQADFIVVCCSLSEATHHLIDARAFSLMKPDAHFLNVGRGPIHDEAALIDALQRGAIAGAGLDVTEVEPIAPDSPLLTMENTIITAHALCWTDECFEDIARTALRSIADVSLGRRPRHAVNPDAANHLEVQA